MSLAPLARGAATGAAMLALAAGCARPGTDAATPADTSAIRAEVSAMLDTSAVAWNRGDLDAFVSFYADGDRTTYIGRSGVVHGVPAIRAVYAPRFAPGGVRDSLSFEQPEVDALAPGVVNAIAWYVLSRGDSVVARGPTSLVMLRQGGGWRIVHDHSS